MHFISYLFGQSIGIGESILTQCVRQVEEHAQETSTKKHLASIFAGSSRIVRLYRLEVRSNKCQNSKTCILVKDVLRICECVSVPQRPTVHPVFKNVDFVVDRASRR